MKFIWEESDIICGRIVGKDTQLDYEVCGNSAKHTHKIGFNATLPSKKNYILIAMTDGMVGKGRTGREMADYLNKSQYAPMPHKQFMKTMEWLRDIYNKKYD